MDFSRFPLDSQNCSLELESCACPPRNIFSSCVIFIESHLRCFFFLADILQVGKTLQLWIQICSFFRHHLDSKIMVMMRGDQMRADLKWLSSGSNIMPQMLFESRTLIKWCHYSTIQMIHVYEHEFSKGAQSFASFLHLLASLLYPIQMHMLRTTSCCTGKMVMTLWGQMRLPSLSSSLKSFTRHTVWRCTAARVQHAFLSLLLCIHTMTNLISLSCLVIYQ